MNSKKNLFVIIIFIFIISIFLLVTEDAISANEINTGNTKVDNVNLTKVPDDNDILTQTIKGQGNGKSEGNKLGIAVNKNDKDDSGKEEDKNFSDFNGDGVVDARDVNIMKNILNISLQQAISLVSSLIGQNLWVAAPQYVENLPVNLDTQVLMLMPQHQNLVIVNLGGEGSLEGQINLGKKQSNNKDGSSVADALPTSVVLSKDMSDLDMFERNNGVVEEARKKIEWQLRGGN